MTEGHLKCLICGGDLCWDSNTTTADLYDDYEGDNIAVVNHLHCTNCGRDYEIVDPIEEERETTYKDYWNENKRQEN